MTEIARVAASDGVESLIAALERDGACVVGGALTAEQLSGLNADLDGVIASGSPESRNPNHPTMDVFYGSKTIRLDGVPDKSATFVEFLSETPALDVCEHFLKPNCPDYLLNTSQLIQIGQIDNLDQVLMANMAHGLGFGLSLEGRDTTQAENSMFWGGWGGSLAVVDFDNRVSFSYVMNRMDASLTGDPRNQRIAAADYDSLD